MANKQKKPVTYDGGWFYPRDPFYYTVDKPVVEEEVVENEETRKVRLYTEAVAQRRQLRFCYNGGSRPGEVRTVQPVNASTAQHFKAQEDGVLKTYLYSLIEQMQIV